MQEQRLTGSFYTCNHVADYLTNWAIRQKDDRLLEPSFGDGVFIDAALAKFRKIGSASPQIYAVELQQSPFEKYIANNAAAKIEGFCKDFMLFNEKIEVDAVVGNPPYVSLRNLKETQRKNAINAAGEMQIKLLTSGSLWMPFVIHSTKFLKQKGRIGFVLPYELTYVKYAYPLWNYLCRSFGKISVCRVHEDFFPDVDVETILLMAEEFGESTQEIEYRLYRDLQCLFGETPQQTASIRLRDVVAGEKPFVLALLSDEQRALLNELRAQKKIQPLASFCKFKIGYVCADKKFFHPTEQMVEQYNIPPQQLLPCVSNAKQINGGTGIGATIQSGQCPTKLYVPYCETEADRRYLEYGERNQINERYKCKIRSPWYITPGIEKADLILTVFGDTPKLVANEGDYAVSNSLLSGTLTGEISQDEIVCRWYNSLTLLSAELKVHSLGGGVLVFIPGETDRIEVLGEIANVDVGDTIRKISDCIVSKKLADAYLLGDDIVLKEGLGFSQAEIECVRAALHTLQYWRRPEHRRPKK